MERFTLHIFGYGETQINSKDLKVKVKTTELTKVQPLVDAVWSKKPEDKVGNKEDFRSITFFDFSKISWQGKTKEESFRIKEEDSAVKELINELIAELETKK